MRTVVPILLVVLFFAVFPSSADAGDLALELGERSVDARGVTPGGEVAWLAVAHVPKPYVLLKEPRHGVLLDDDADGHAEIKFDQAIPARSTWVMVDLESGEVAVASPEGFATRWIDGSDSLIHSPQGELNRLQAGRGTPLVLVVRPGVGAWGIEAGDGGPYDADGLANGTVTVALDRTQSATPATGELAAPADLQLDDLVIALNVDRLTVSVQRVGQETGLSEHQQLAGERSAASAKGGAR